MKNLVNRSLSRRRFLERAGKTGAAAAAGAAFGPFAPRPAGIAAAQSSVIGASAVPLAASGQLEQQEIAVGIFQSPHAEAVRRLGPQFTDLTGGKVSVRVESSPFDAIQPRKLAMWQAGGDDWDVVWLHGGEWSQIRDSEFAVPLTDYMKPEWLDPTVFNLEDFPAPLLDMFGYEGKHYVLPFEASAYMQFARTDLLEQYAPGSPLPPVEGYTWEQFIEIAQTVQEGINSAGVPDLWATAYIFKTSGDISGAIMWESTVRSFGHQPFKEDGTPDFNGDLAVEATQMLHDLVFKYKVASPGVAGYYYQDILEIVNSGKAVLPLQWNASAETNELPDKSQSAGKLAYAAFPYAKAAGPTVQRVYPSEHGLSVNPASSKLDAALEFVFWYTSPEVARDYVANGGGVSGRRSLLTDPEIVGAHPWYPAMAKSYEYYFVLPSTPAYAQLQAEAIGRNVIEAWTGNATVKEALDKAQEEALSIMESVGS
ncbi:MAG: multiple sugar transport system substrate-binding protein [Thermomicrobiales bacterium]|nr:multiple sugar transport system substrate-binding protein [Thermomicrobiales bacterium]